jgi:predicted MFS family arabinose efflux permease
MTPVADRNTAFTRRINVQLMTLTLVLLIAASGLFSWGAVRVFGDALAPALTGKSATIGDIVARQIGAEAVLGVPFDQIPGVEDFLRPIIAAHPETAYIAIADTQGHILYASGPRLKTARPLLETLGPGRATGISSAKLGVFLDTTVPVTGEAGVIGSVHFGVAQSFVQNTLEEMVYDVLVVVLVSMLVTFEILLILINISIATPIRLANDLLAQANRGDFRHVIGGTAHDEVGRLVDRINGVLRSIWREHQRLVARIRGSEGREDGEAGGVLAALAARFRFAEPAGPQPLETVDLARIRAPLFLFMFAEELSRSFFPLYVHDLYTPIAGLSDKVVMGLPIALFMLIVAVFTPFAGAWCDRFGVRRTLLIGMVPAVVGFAGTALSHSLYELLFWRSLCAVSYAIMFIGAQGFVAHHTSRRNRASGMATFVGAVIAAGICGVSIGGILADQIGFRATFAVSTLLALAATVAVALLLPSGRRDIQREQPVTLRDYGVVLRNPRFLALLMFSSIPTKVMLTGYLFYIIPLYLNDLGETQSAIGRIMMAYGLTVMVLAPWISRIADRSGRHALFAGVGGLIAGAGALLVFEANTALVVLISVVSLGLAHAFNNATQLALVPEVCRAECERIGRSSVFAIYRLLERGGSVLGPVIAAALAERFGYQQALGLLGVLGIVCGVLFCAAFMLTRSEAVDESEEIAA